MDTIVWLCRWSAWPFVLLLRFERDNGEHHPVLLFFGFIVGIILLIIFALDFFGSDIIPSLGENHLIVLLSSLALYYFLGLLFSVRKKIARDKFKKRDYYIH